MNEAKDDRICVIEPCPICESPPRIFRTPGEDFYAVGCDNARCPLSRHLAPSGRGIVEAVNNWNASVRDDEK